MLSGRGVRAQLFCSPSEGRIEYYVYKWSLYESCYTKARLRMNTSGFLLPHTTYIAFFTSVSTNNQEHREEVTARQMGEGNLLLCLTQLLYTDYPHQ
jgi:hypothetical protein